MAIAAVTAMAADGDVKTPAKQQVAKVNSGPVITLNGPNPLTLCDEDYTEYGATAADYAGKDLSSSIVITGADRINGYRLNSQYEVTYRVVDGLGNEASVVRAVNVPSLALNLTGTSGTIDVARERDADGKPSITIPDLTVSNLIVPTVPCRDLTWSMSVAGTKVSPGSYTFPGGAYADLNVTIQACASSETCAMCAVTLHPAARNPVKIDVPEEPITLNCGAVFNPGDYRATARYSDGATETLSGPSVNNVDPSVPGTYYLAYEAHKTLASGVSERGVAWRKVVVQAGAESPGTGTPPDLVLLPMDKSGEAMPVQCVKEHGFKDEKGWTFHMTDNGTSMDMVVTPEDGWRAGPHLITYTVTGAGAAPAKCVRTRRVYAVEKPNLLMIVTDDMNAWQGYVSKLKDASGKYVDGHPNAYYEANGTGHSLTPNMDSLATSGRAFRYAYCPAPICYPSRSAVLTGRAPWRTGRYLTGRWWEEPDAKRHVLPRVFRETLHYRTTCFGKVFHGATEARYGIENAPKNGPGNGIGAAASPEVSGDRNASAGYGDDSVTRGILETDITFPAANRNYGQCSIGERASDSPWTNMAADMNTRDACNTFLNKESVASPAPFFTAVGFQATHVASYAAAADFEAVLADGARLYLPRPYCYAGSAAPSPASFFNDNATYGYWSRPLKSLSGKDYAVTPGILEPPAGVDYAAFLENNVPHVYKTSFYPPRARQLLNDGLLFDPVKARGGWAAYALAYLATIHNVDMSIGSVIGGLESSGLSQSTIVALWGDHGFQLGEQEHLWKATLWEGATRVPLIIKVPWMHGHAEALSNTPVSTLDLYPTLYKLCAGEDCCDPNLDGVDIVDIVESGGSNSPRGTSTGAGVRGQPVISAWYTEALDGKEEPVFGIRGDLTAPDGSVTPYRYIRYAASSLGEGRFTAASWLSQYANGTMPADFKEELYNLAADPSEVTNLVLDGYSPEEQTVIKALDAFLPGSGSGKKPAAPVDAIFRAEKRGSSTAAGVCSTCPLSGGCNSAYGFNTATSHAYSCGFPFPPNTMDECPGGECPVSVGIEDVATAHESVTNGDGTTAGEDTISVPIMVYAAHGATGLKGTLYIEYPADTKGVKVKPDSPAEPGVATATLLRSKYEPIRPAVRMNHSRWLNGQQWTERWTVDFETNGNASDSAMEGRARGLVIQFKCTYGAPEEDAGGLRLALAQVEYHVGHAASSAQGSGGGDPWRSADIVPGLRLGTPRQGAMMMNGTEMSLTPANRARDITDPAYGIPDGNLRRRVMDYLPSTHNASTGVAYAWPCAADSITVLHAEDLGIANLTGLTRSAPNRSDRFTGLRELYLDDNPGTADKGLDLAPLKGLPLTTLNLKGCTYIVNQGQVLPTLSSLTHLDLSGCEGKATDRFRALTGVSRLGNLKYVDLSNCRNLTGSPAQGPLAELVANRSFSGPDRTLKVTGVPGVNESSSVIYGELTVLAERRVAIQR